MPSLAHGDARMMLHSISAMTAGQRLQIIGQLAGYLTLGLALAVYLFDLKLVEMLAMVDQLFGSLFVTAYLALAAGSYYCFCQLAAKDGELWLEAGLQCATGIATLALTFTLLGISLGVHTIAAGGVTAEQIVSQLPAMTERFAMAFATTIVGLPTANLIRAAMTIKWKQIHLSKES